MVENVADTPQAPVEDNRLNPMFVDDVVAALEAEGLQKFDDSWAELVQTVSDALAGA